VGPGVGLVDSGTMGAGAGLWGQRGGGRGHRASNVVRRKGGCQNAMNKGEGAKRAFPCTPLPTPKVPDGPVSVRQTLHRADTPVALSKVGNRLWLWHGAPPTVGPHSSKGRGRTRVLSYLGAGAGEGVLPLLCAWYPRAPSTVRTTGITALSIVV
jgi:hypothetical protein